MLSFYEVDWQDVVRQCYDALRRRNECEATQAAAVAEPALRTIYYGDNNPLPQALLLDRRLTPLERNTWLVLHWLITERQIKTPRYHDLQPYLATSPCGTQASRETIARALNVLRTTRWLSLVDRSRDAQGCLRGCVYVLHGDPLTAAEQLELDSGYVGLLLQNLFHATKGVRDVTQHVLAEIQADPHVAQSDKDKLGSLPPAQQQTLPLMNESAQAQHSEPGLRHPVRNAHTSATDPEPCGKAPVSAVVRNPDAGRTVQKDQSKKSTVLAQVEFGRARWPEDLPLNPTERRMASQAMRQLEPEQQQAVINEAAVRCARGEIRKPVAYLMGLIKRACQGEFTLWAARAEATTATTAPSLAPKAMPAQPPGERPKRGGQRTASPLALSCLEELKQRCRGSLAPT
ncbi:STY4528 family pathogenicity island replication protein [Pseudomonas putida]|uniref:STY4528 family pathogenicity island replication protein n=1 Tax=Pseudomonas putida TaxID=303 RepID=UPI0021F8FB39|nr:STY4528 family pathogenicity island replication protein [Pseudomonas putida]